MWTDLIKLCYSLCWCSRFLLCLHVIVCFCYNYMKVPAYMCVYTFVYVYCPCLKKEDHRIATSGMNEVLLNCTGHELDIRRSLISSLTRSTDKGCNCFVCMLVSWSVIALCVCMSLDRFNCQLHCQQLFRQWVFSTVTICCWSVPFYLQRCWLLSNLSVVDLDRSDWQLHQQQLWRHGTLSQCGQTGLGAWAESQEFLHCHTWFRTDPCHHRERWHGMYI